VTSALSREKRRNRRKVLMGEGIWFGDLETKRLRGLLFATGRLRLPSGQRV
jgi:hypothetical protein